MTTTAPLPHRLRVAAYGVCEREGSVLLTHWVSPDGATRHWSMPGGGVEHGEDPADAVVREWEEETGHTVEVERLLGVDSLRIVPSAIGDDFHTLRLAYAVRITGGTLRPETDGSSDDARWFTRAEIAALPRSGMVDAALTLYDERPADGRPGAGPYVDRA